MKRYLIVSAFIALLIGLIIGYSFAYNVYQPYNQQLERTLGTSENSDTVDVNITNWPPQKPDCQLIQLGEFKIPSGLAYRFDVPDWNNPINANGYTKFSVLYEISDMSPGNYKLNVSITTITWIILHGPYAQEHVQMAQAGLTRHAQGWDGGTSAINLVEIKAPYFSLGFQTRTDDPDWMNIWVVINAYVYLRN